MSVFSSGSFEARVIPQPSGVVEVVYGGVATDKTFSELSEVVVKETRRYGALVIRMEAVVMALSDVPTPPTYTKSMPPAAVVCSESHVVLWDAYGKEVSRMGVMRAVFSSSQLDLARLWALRQIRARL